MRVQAGEVAAKPQSGHYRWTVLSLAIMAYGASLFARQNFTGVQKFIAADLHLDKGSLGMLGSVFFYSYALWQMPWGVASDRWGSRGVISVGVLLIAATMAAFAVSRSETELLVWRTLSGIASAAVFVAATGGVARWFPPEERGLGQAAFLGVGGAAGETTAFFLLPALSVYFASGWRPAMGIVAVALGVIGVLCAVFFRSAPQKAAALRGPAVDAALLTDARLWTFTFLFCGFIVAARIAQQWISMYAADVYVEQGMIAASAVVRGGLLVVVMFSICGRGIGCPIVGRLSDIALRRGISRLAMASGWLVVLVALLVILARGVPTPLLVGAIACALSVAINSFSLISAAIADTYGPERTASVLGFVNMVAQLCGATALAVSGYAGMAFRGHTRSPLAEYQGIWLSAAIGVTVMLGFGLAIQRVGSRIRALA
jgi:MFS family permease